MMPNPRGLRSANLLPHDHHIFTFVLSQVPIESTSVLVKARMHPPREEVEAHQKHGEGGEADVDKSNLAHLSVVSASPRHHPITNHHDNWGEIEGNMP